MNRNRTYTLVSSKLVFRISLLVAVLTVAGVFFWGLGRHTTFFENSMLSTTVLSIAFFLFLTVSLYRGVKLKEDVGKIKPFEPAIADLPTTGDAHHALPSLDVGDGLAGIVIGILLWILWAVLLAVVLWLFANVFLVMLAVFAAMLYWVFFRAMRLVFKNSSKTKGKIWMSIGYAAVYTVVYNFWIYGIFILVEYLKR